MAAEQRYKATVEYDGTDFLGYQLQASGRTVQGELEKSLATVTQSFVRVHAAGRTDAGVHATGQIIAFDVAWRHSTAVLQRALNATLPDDIVISKLTTTDREFHPRFWATSRTYRYQLASQPWPNVLRRRYVYYVRQPLNLVAMNQACHCLLGQHDFASFGKPPHGDKTVRHVMKATWQQTASGELHFWITANAFLYRMVRNIVGTLVEVGTGQLSAAEVEKILAAKTLQRSAPAAPAHGLCLVNVTYPKSR